MLNGFSWPGQEACWGARLVSFEAYGGHGCDGDDGTPLDVRQLGVRGLCRWDCSNPAPAIAAGQEREFSVERPLLFFWIIM